MGIDDNKLSNTRFATLFSDFSYWYEEVNTDKSLKKLNYGTFRNYLLAYMEKYNITNIFMRSVVSKEGTKERVIVTDEVSERNFNKELYKLSLQDIFNKIGNDIRALIQGYKVCVGITGAAGTGKTKIVTDILSKEAKGFKIKYIKGGISKPADLYKVLVENNSDKTIIVFDDTEIFLTKAGYKRFEGITKAMLSSDMRIVSWISDKTGDSKKRPEEILLKSKIIIISNIRKDALPEPVYSRLQPVEVTASIPDMADYLEQNLEGILPQYPSITNELKKEVLDLIRTYIKDVVHLDFRIFQECLIYRVTDPEDPRWRKYCLNILAKVK